MTHDLSGARSPLHASAKLYLCHGGCISVLVMCAHGSMNACWWGIISPGHGPHDVLYRCNRRMILVCMHWITLDSWQVARSRVGGTTKKVHARMRLRRQYHMLRTIFPFLKSRGVRCDECTRCVLAPGTMRHPSAYMIQNWHPMADSNSCCMHMVR